ncbi:MAG TPA: NUDIX domain-containing protein [Candidatus Nanoarchaeia archaeon]|nr:NUDIX domain-containing protein [Candidatus Nanoarchaeia archaeon]
MQSFAIAVKSFIVNDANQLLLLKRRANDPHKPGTWDIPGGRLDSGEDPLAGLLRETAEETHLPVTVVGPLGVHHFTRDDGQRITMLIFLCRAMATDVELSEEHTEYRWAALDGSSLIPDWLFDQVAFFTRYFKR